MVELWLGWGFDKIFGPNSFFWIISLHTNNLFSLFMLDPQVLLFGPGYSSHGKSEVLSLPDLSPLNCSLPAYPDGRYHSYVGRSTNEGVLMCGGMTNSGITSSCYLLTSSGYQEMPGLINKRTYAASVVTPLGLWVTGKSGVILLFDDSFYLRRI